MGNTCQTRKIKNKTKIQIKRRSNRRSVNGRVGENDNISNTGLDRDRRKKGYLQHLEEPRDIKEGYKDWLEYERVSSENTEKLMMDIRKGTAIAVSDGSYVKELGLGNAAWIIYI